jgi:enamine deaminase RidA (YjgF/YER057c/UK114 family)
MRKLVVICVMLLPLAILVAKKKKPDETQVLELPKDPPQAVTAETRNLVFHVAPLSAKGLLSQQTRDAVKALLKVKNGSTIVHIRAFVAGSGDMRRVPAIISETMTEKKLPLPAVSVVQAGGLPLEGAQVELESISVSRREVNPAGLLFVAAQSAADEKPLEPVMPLAERALASLGKLMEGEPVRVTCFTSSLDGAAKLVARLASLYPQAAVDVVEAQRAPAHSSVACEGTARLARPVAGGVEYRADSQAVAVSAAKLALTGTQMAFGFEDKDVMLAFQRLDKAIVPLGTSARQIVFAHFYPLSRSIARQVSNVRAEFFDPGHVPAVTMLPVEGLPSLNASFAVDAAAVVR